MKNVDPRFLAGEQFGLAIAGQGGGGKRSRGGGGGSEAPNSLHSKQVARIIDLLSEGPIVGPVDDAKSVYFDGVPVLADDGTPNFQNWSIAGNAGWPGQPLLPGFASQQAETAVGLQIKKDTPITRTITDADTDRARVTVSVPALQVQNTTTGNITGTSVVFNVYLQSNGGGYALVTQHTISGKTNTTYQRSLTFALVGDPPWDIRLERVTADSTTNNVQNDLYWDSYTAIIDDRVNYTLSAVIGVTIDAEQFQAIPRRTYDIKGLIIQVPSNYDPETRSYTGVWDGTFRLAWTNNPAWVFYDLVVNGRYGLGNFVHAADVDKWALYRIGQWCDENVPDGQGGQEPRFICNAVINTQQEAFDLLSSIASVFRGWAFWAGGQMVAVADQPADPVHDFTNANVIDGAFTYHGADIRSRHNMVAVQWNDSTNLGEPRITMVEDVQAISRYGVQKTDLIAIGCTSEGQAVRSGRWLLYSDTYEGETVYFVAGLEAAWARPGDKARIADINIGGERRGGRLVSATTDRFIIDAPVTFRTGIDYYASCVLPGGAIETRQAFGAGTTSMFAVNPPFSQAPLPDTTWILASSDLEPTLWRIIDARESEPGRYEINAVRHFPGKWAWVESNIPLSKPDISNIGGIPGVSGLNATDYIVALSPISIGVRMLISWQSKAPSFEVAYRPVNGNWIRARIDQTAIDVEALEGTYEIWVTPINVLGRRGTTSKISYVVIGRSALPDDPYNFRVQVVEGVAMFQWGPTDDIDVLIGGAFEIRYSPRTTGATWTSSNTVLTSIPGTATTVELPYRPGTYLIKARDILGQFSTGAALIVVTALASTTKQFVRICEHPTWSGSKTNVRVQMPQEWLVIVDSGAGLGEYIFQNQIDMGGEFPVLLTVDMLAFPYFESDTFIDERSGLVDDWQDWDSALSDGQGMVTIRVRQTNDDPASGTAVWTAWKQFLSGEYTGRGFQFSAWLNAPDGQNVAIESLCIIADVTAKIDQGADVSWLPLKQHIDFTIKFIFVPSISVAIQEGVVGDTFRISNKSNTGFDLELIGADGQPITAHRTFDWIASGY